MATNVSSTTGSELSVEVWSLSPNSFDAERLPERRLIVAVPAAERAAVLRCPQLCCSRQDTRILYLAVPRAGQEAPWKESGRLAHSAPFTTHTWLINADESHKLVRNHGSAK